MELVLEPTQWAALRASHWVGERRRPRMVQVQPERPVRSRAVAAVGLALGEGSGLSLGVTVKVAVCSWRVNLRLSQSMIRISQVAV